MRKFKPRRFAVNRELLERWRAEGHGVNWIADRYGCNPSTVRNWLIRLGLPTEMPLRQPLPEDVSGGSTVSTGDAA